MQSALGLSLALSLALVAVTAATDGGVAWPTRLARLVPLLPIPAGVAYALTLWRAARRGETRALEAIGVEPWTWQRWAAVAALAPAVLGALALAAGLDPSGLFPEASSAKPCAVLPGGAFSCVQAGLRVQGASLELLAASSPQAPASARGFFAAGAVLLTGVAVLHGAGAASSRPLTGLFALALLLAETGVCQAVGAGAIPAGAALVLPALANAGTSMLRRVQTKTAHVRRT